MVTALRLGLKDQGTPLSLEAFLSASYQAGYKYELINGKLAVSPETNLPEYRVQIWLYDILRAYSKTHQAAINFVAPGGRVFVPGGGEVTAPEPDFVAYKDFPLDLPDDEVHWEDVSPVLVAEVLSPETPDKDLVRNVDLYFRVPSIKEYWVLDGRQSTRYPVLIAHRRFGKKWRIQNYPGGSTYTSRLLPDFSMLLDTRS